MVGISISWAPVASCSSRTIWLIFRNTRWPAGSHEYIPAADWRIMPDRSINRCETICASAGFSFKVGRNNWVRRIFVSLERNWSARTVR